ncbi:MAG: M48 family peptidase, partial [Oscillatoriales cyanobacterium]
ILPAIVAKWEPVMDVSINEARIKRMKTKWGTCNIKARRIWLNLELIRTPPHCLEYVVVHEMTHLLERLHNDRFHRLLDRFLPSYAAAKRDLDRFKLST